MLTKIFQDAVLVKPVLEKEKNGLIVPVSAQKECQRGLVAMCGPGKKDRDDFIIPLTVKPADVIMYVKFAGSEVQLDGEDYLIMREHDILGIYNRPPDPIDILPLRDRIFLEWEEGRDEYLGSKILRADMTKQRHYTGIVKSIGGDVSEVGVGDRVFFDQFCGPERIDHEGKRYAFIFEYNVYCLLPSRAEMSVLSD